MSEVRDTPQDPRAQFETAAVGLKNVLVFQEIPDGTVAAEMLTDQGEKFVVSHLTQTLGGDQLVKRVIITSEVEGGNEKEEWTLNEGAQAGLEYRKTQIEEGKTKIAALGSFNTSPHAEPHPAGIPKVDVFQQFQKITPKLARARHAAPLR